LNNVLTQEYSLNESLSTYIDIIKSAVNHEPSQRPTFEFILVRLESLLDNITKAPPKKEMKFENTNNEEYGNTVDDDDDGNINNNNVVVVQPVTVSGDFKIPEFQIPSYYKED